MIMSYLLKASALIAIIYICYILFLQRETFFNSNRWFLILGLLTAVLFPLLVIPIYVEMPTASYEGFHLIGTTAPNNPETSFNLNALSIWIYAIGVSVFFVRSLIHHFSLILLIKNNNKEKIGNYTYIKTSQNITPFSFFKWIVYNPKPFSEEELDLILQHEKIHASQFHSIDALIMDLTVILFWYNPFIWFYRKALKQNLEFIADHHTQTYTDNEERYQKLLLKTSLPEQNLTLINTFYNSTIKKRILMLHKSKSNLMNTWKYSIIVPLLVIFALTFNTKIIAQTTDDVSKSASNDQQNILKFVITKDTKDTQLDYIKNKLADYEATISFNNLKRNSKSEITSIKIEFEYQNNSGNHAVKSTDPINSVEISLNPSDASINLGQQTSALSQTFDVKPNDSGQTSLKKIAITKFDTIYSDKKSGNQESYQVVGYKINDDNVINKDTIFYITNNTGKVHTVKDLKGENKQLMLFKKKDKQKKPFIDAENSPLVFLDGKEIKTDELNTINPDEIKSMEVLKDKTVTEKYGEKGKNGVIFILSKEGTTYKTDDEIVLSKEKILITNNGKTPLYILDGEEITLAQMNAIEANDIASVFILKDKSATKKYGKKGKNGVVIITLKKD